VFLKGVQEDPLRYLVDRMFYPSGQPTMPNTERMMTIEIIILPQFHQVSYPQIACCAQIASCYLTPCSTPVAPVAPHCVAD